MKLESANRIAEAVLMPWWGVSCYDVIIGITQMSLLALHSITCNPLLEATDKRGQLVHDLVNVTKVTRSLSAFHSILITVNSMEVFIDLFLCSSTGQGYTDGFYRCILITRNSSPCNGPMLIFSTANYIIGFLDQFCLHRCWIQKEVFVVICSISWWCFVTLSKFCYFVQAMFFWRFCDTQMSVRHPLMFYPSVGSLSFWGFSFPNEKR